MSASPSYSANGMPDRRVRRQDEQAFGVAADPELARRAHHALGDEPAQLRPLDLDAARQHGPDHGDGDLVAGLEVRARRTRCAAARPPPTSTVQ